MTRCLRRLQARLRYGRFDRDLTVELELHREMKERELLAKGLTSEEALRQARRDLGSVVLAREDVRAVWIAPWIESIWQDACHAARSFRRDRVFTATTGLTLAVGIGATTSIFSIVNGTLFKPLPYRDPDRVVMLMGWDAKTGSLYESVGSVEAMALHRSRSLAAVASYVPFPDVLTSAGRGERESVRVAAVSSGFFDVLGVHPVLGRAFQTGERRAGSSLPVILTHSYWQRRFAGDPAALGRAIAFESDTQAELGGSGTIVGVLPVDFWYPRMTLNSQPDLLIADDDDGADPPSVDARFFLLGRLRTGVSLVSAQAEVTALVASVNRVGKMPGLQQLVAVMSLRTQMVAHQRSELLTILGGVLCLLLIACVNVANLMLARGAARERELALRASLGASRSRIARQLITESVALAVGGACTGILFSFWTFDVLLSELPSQMRLVGDLAIDGWTLSFAAGVTVASILIFGVVPAVRMSMTASPTSLKAGPHPTRTDERFRGRRLLIAVEAALALMLLAGAGLLVNSSLRFKRIELGFEPDRLLETGINAPRSRFPDNRTVELFFDQAVERLRAVPGVSAVATGDVAPLSGALFTERVRIDGRGRDERVDVYRVGPGYFDVLGQALLRGRMLVRQDSLPSVGVAVVNETMARRYWGAENALGRLINLSSAAAVRVVGVVRDVRSDVRRPPGPTLYVPYDASYRRFRARTVIIRTAQGHGDIGPAIVRELATVDPGQTARVSAVQRSVDRTAASPRFYTLLYGTFAAIGLLLAAVGVAGVSAQTVIRRTHEIGVRLALGARPGRVVLVLLRQVVLPVGGGVLAGLGGAWAMSQSLESLLFDVTPHDPVTYALVAVLIVAVSASAAWLPARRAASINPIDVLRAD
jgi:putative ABC transport system permease protein